MYKNKNRLTELIKDALKRPVKEDKVKGSNIKKVGDKWRVLSGKTGKMWKQKYDTKEDAEAGLKGYFASQNESLSEEEFTDKHDDNPKLKGKQKDLPDALQKAIVDKVNEMVRKKLGKVPSPDKMMSKRKMKTPSGVGFSMDYEVNEVFGGDDLTRGEDYDIRDIGGVYGKVGDIKEDFTYVGFDRNEQEHIFVSQDAGGDTFIRIPDEDVYNMVMFTGTMMDSELEELDEDKDWIQKAIKRPGALRKKLGVKKGKDIPKGEINKAIAKLKKKDKDDEEKGTQLSKGDERELRQLNLAKTLSKLKK